MLSQSIISNSSQILQRLQSTSDWIHAYTRKHISLRLPMSWSGETGCWKREWQEEEEGKRGMKDSTIWLITFVILPGRQQTYRLNTETDTQAHAYFNKYPHMDMWKIFQHVQQSLCKEPEGIKWQTNSLSSIQSIQWIMACACVFSLCMCLHGKQPKDFRVGFHHTNGDKAVQLPLSFLSTQCSRSVDGKSPEKALCLHPVLMLQLDHTDTCNSLKQRE